jgi:hypothetical protein
MNVKKDLNKSLLDFHSQNTKACTSDKSLGLLVTSINFNLKGIFGRIYCNMKKEMKTSVDYRALTTSSAT